MWNVHQNGRCFHGISMVNDALQLLYTSHTRKLVMYNDACSASSDGGSKSVIETASKYIEGLKNSIYIEQNNTKLEVNN